ncbi:unnamed protein product [Pedinophyceae sp. YPF-701]|nr:unnamed protein product [Pedinophyceae sp. YPF-701]
MTAHAEFAPRRRALCAATIRRTSAVVVFHLAFILLGCLAASEALGFESIAATIDLGPLAVCPANEQWIGPVTTSGAVSLIGDEVPRGVRAAASSASATYKCDTTGRVSAIRASWRPPAFPFSLFPGATLTLSDALVSYSLTPPPAARRALSTSVSWTEAELWTKKSAWDAAHNDITSRALSTSYTIEHCKQDCLDDPFCLSLAHVDTSGGPTTPPSAVGGVCWTKHKALAGYADPRGAGVEYWTKTPAALYSFNRAPDVFQADAGVDQRYGSTICYPLASYFDLARCQDECLADPECTGVSHAGTAPLSSTAGECCLKKATVAPEASPLGSGVVLYRRRGAEPPGAPLTCKKLSAAFTLKHCRALCLGFAACTGHTHAPLMPGLPLSDSSA